MAVPMILVPPEHSPILCLPTEVLALVFVHCAVHDPTLSAVRLTCRQFHTAARAALLDRALHGLVVAWNTHPCWTEKRVLALVDRLLLRIAAHTAQPWAVPAHTFEALLFVACGRGYLDVVGLLLDRVVFAPRTLNMAALCALSYGHKDLCALFPPAQGMGLLQPEATGSSHPPPVFYLCRVCHPSLHFNRGPVLAVFPVLQFTGLAGQQVRLPGLYGWHQHWQAEWDLEYFGLTLERVDTAFAFTAAQLQTLLAEVESRDHDNAMGMLRYEALFGRTVLPLPRYVAAPSTDAPGVLCGLLADAPTSVCALDRALRASTLVRVSTRSWPVSAPVLFRAAQATSSHGARPLLQHILQGPDQSWRRCKMLLALVAAACGLDSLATSTDPDLVGATGACFMHWAMVLDLAVVFGTLHTFLPFLSPSGRAPHPHRLELGVGVLERAAANGLWDIVGQLVPLLEVDIAARLQGPEGCTVSSMLPTDYDFSAGRRQSVEEVCLLLALHVLRARHAATLQDLLQRPSVFGWAMQRAVAMPRYMDDQVLVWEPYQLNRGVPAEAYFTTSSSELRRRYRSIEWPLGDAAVGECLAVLVASPVGLVSVVGAGLGSRWFLGWQLHEQVADIVCSVRPPSALLLQLEAMWRQPEGQFTQQAVLGVALRLCTGAGNWALAGMLLDRYGEGLGTADRMCLLLHHPTAKQGGKYVGTQAAEWWQATWLALQHVPCNLLAAVLHGVTLWHEAKALLDSSKQVQHAPPDLHMRVLFAIAAASKKETRRAAVNCPHWAHLMPLLCALCDAHVDAGQHTATDRALLVGRLVTVAHTALGHRQAELLRVTSSLVPVDECYEDYVQSFVFGQPTTDQGRPCVPPIMDWVAGGDRQVLARRALGAFHVLFPSLYRQVFDLLISTLSSSDPVHPHTVLAAMWASSTAKGKSFLAQCSTAALAGALQATMNDVCCDQAFYRVLQYLLGTCWAEPGSLPADAVDALEAIARPEGNTLFGAWIRQQDRTRALRPTDSGVTWDGTFLVAWALQRGYVGLALRLLDIYPIDADDHDNLFLWWTVQAEGAAVFINRLYGQDPSTWGGGKETRGKLEAHMVLHKLGGGRVLSLLQEKAPIGHDTEVFLHVLTTSPWHLGDLALVLQLYAPCTVSPQQALRVIKNMGASSNGPFGVDRLRLLLADSRFVQGQPYKAFGELAARLTQPQHNDVRSTLLAMCTVPGAP